VGVFGHFVPRRLAAQLAAVVVVGGLVPFAVVGAWTWFEVKNRMTEAVVESWLVRIAREAAAQVDREVDRMRATATAWSEDEQTYVDARSAGAEGPEGRFAAQRLSSALGRRAERRGDVTFLGVVSRDGRILAAASSDRALPTGALAGRRLDEIFDGPAERAWIDAAFAAENPGLSVRDFHRSPLAAAAGASDARRYEIGCAAAVLGPNPAPGARADAALVAIFGMEPVQHVLDQVQRRFAEPEVAGSDAPPRYPSGYPFLFAADCDRVIGHRDRALLGTSLVENHGQGTFRLAMLERAYGFHHYDYPVGVGKISGFARCAGRGEGGFGWVVGVGVNRADVFADARRLGEALLVGAAAVAGCVALLAALFARRTAERLRLLVVQTERFARGDYEARTDDRRRDEIGVLADAFNRLGADLLESNRRLVEAEKNAAWKEMARQVAHEIKNPLTPIMLSAQQIERAHRDRHPRLSELVAESVASIVEQCAALKRIAQNFASYAAFPQSRKEPRAFGRLVEDAVRLYAPAREEGPSVVVRIDVPPDVRVLADEDELRRVFLNLFNNAFDAMGGAAGGAGTLTVAATLEGADAAERAVVRVSDTGRGIAEDDRARLFEPYFSTRSGGTGLGLAICRKIVQEHRGEISFRSEVGRGTTFTIALPRYRGEGADGASDPFADTRTVHRA
jgi:signal transduction histidine kinase